MPGNEGVRVAGARIIVYGIIAGENFREFRGIAAFRESIIRESVWAYSHGSLRRYRSTMALNKYFAPNGLHGIRTVVPAAAHLCTRWLRAHAWISLAQLIIRVAIGNPQKFYSRYALLKPIRKTFHTRAFPVSR